MKYEIYNLVSFDNNSLSFLINWMLPNKFISVTLIKKEWKISKGCSINLIHTAKELSYAPDLEDMFKEKLWIEITPFMFDIFIQDIFRSIIPHLNDESIENLYKF